MNELVSFLIWVILFLLGLTIILNPIKILGIIFLPFEKLLGFKTLLYETKDAYYFYNYPPMKK